MDFGNFFSTYIRDTFTSTKLERPEKDDTPHKFEPLYFKNFMSFQLVYCWPYDGRDHMTGQVIPVPGKLSLNIKTDQFFSNYINNEEEELRDIEIISQTKIPNLDKLKKELTEIRRKLLANENVTFPGFTKFCIEKQMGGRKILSMVKDFEDVNDPYYNFIKKIQKDLNII